jgi:hypothetical protein
MRVIGSYNEANTDDRKILIPFEHGLGRRIGGGTWSVSKVALAMFLDGDLKALRAYQAWRSNRCNRQAIFRACGDWRKWTDIRSKSR